jgi:hypothetical protein
MSVCGNRELDQELRDKGRWRSPLFVLGAAAALQHVSWSRAGVLSRPVLPRQDKHFSKTSIDYQVQLYQQIMALKPNPRPAAQVTQHDQALQPTEPDSQPLSAPFKPVHLDLVAS